MYGLKGARMTDWIVQRWARYGKERLYAETPGGTALGYFDVKTGRYHSDDITNLPLLERAVSDYLVQQESQAPAAELSPDRVPATPTTLVRDEEWTDISGTGAGAAARERAIAERRAQGRVRGFLARLIGAKTTERAWRIGADGEQAVAAQLAKLGREWHVLHAVRVGENGADIDHVVIGPSGVFTVNSKNHPGKRVWVGGDTFMINGFRVPYIRNSRHEARRAARLLTQQAGFPVEVSGVVAVMGAHRGFTIRSQPKDGAVVVVPRKHICEHLLTRPQRLTAREIDAIYGVARRSSTWE